MSDTYTVVLSTLEQNFDLEMSVQENNYDIEYFGYINTDTLSSVVQRGNDAGQDIYVNGSKVLTTEDTLSSLNDTNINSPQLGEVLMYGTDDNDEFKWLNTQLQLNSGSLWDIREDATQKGDFLTWSPSDYGWIVSNTNAFNKSVPNLILKGYQQSLGSPTDYVRLQLSSYEKLLAYSSAIPSGRTVDPDYPIWMVVDASSPTCVFRDLDTGDIILRSDFIAGGGVFVGTSTYPSAYPMPWECTFTTPLNSTITIDENLHTVTSSGGITTNDISVGSLSATTINIADGTNDSPSLCFNDDIDTGIYSPTNNTLAVATSGIARLSISDTAISSTLSVLLPDGVLAAPSLAFANDTNTGIYRAGSDNWSFVSGGTPMLNMNVNNGYTYVPLAFVCATLNLGANLQCRFRPSAEGVCDYVTLSSPATGFTPRQFHLYGMGLSTTDYERLEIASTVTPTTLSASTGSPYIITSRALGLGSVRNIAISGCSVGIGTPTPSAKLHSLATTEQLRLGYDASNYISATVGSTGGVTFSNAGTATDVWTYNGNVVLNGSANRAPNQTATTPDAVMTRSTKELEDVFATLMSTGGMVELTNSSVATVTSRTRWASHVNSSTAAGSWSRSYWSLNMGISSASSGQGVRFDQPSEFFGTVTFRSLVNVGARVLAWDTGPATPKRMYEDAYSAKGVGIEFYETGGNVVCRFCYHDGTSYKTSSTTVVHAVAVGFYRHVLFRVLNYGNGTYELYLGSYTDTTIFSGAPSLPLVLTITDGPIGGAPYPTVGNQFTYNMVSMNATDAAGSAASSNAIGLTFRKRY